MFCSCKQLPLYDLTCGDLENNNLENNNLENNNLENNMISYNKNLNLSNELLNHNSDHINYILASKLYKNNIGYKFIEKHYRIGYSFNDCIHSLFFFHNESINIWSHLISCIFFFILLIIHNIYFKKMVLINNLIIIGSIIILFVSTICHLFNPMFNSIKTHKIFFLLDFSGIMIGVLIFEISLFYLLLNKQIKVFYILMIASIIINSLSVLIKTLFSFNNNIILKPNIIYYTLILLNSSLILSAFILSNTHLIFNFNVLFPFITTNLILILSIVLNLIMNYPERKIKNKFDLCCSSHQIWHFVTSFYLLSLVIQVGYWVNYVF